jgi:hypothetical protein
MSGIHGARVFAAIGVVARCVIALFASGVSTGCSGDGGRADGSVTAQDEEGLYYKAAEVFDHRDISVCWTYPGEAANKALVRAAVRGQRSWSKAGNINFVGWGSCGTADIELHYGLNSTGAGTPVEMWLDFDPSATAIYGRCKKNNLNLEQCIQTTALHEFGHALSYYHEQNRDDVPVPGSCTDRNDDHLDGDSTFGPFDSNSLGGYCKLTTELSSLDRTGTEQIYGPPLDSGSRLGDYDGDGYADMFCRDVITGNQWINYANGSGQYSDPDWTSTTTWCTSTETRRVVHGDFNGDHHTDLLCFDQASGARHIDYASASGTFGGTDWYTTGAWCNGADTRELYIGDFNLDVRDDLLCRDRVTGQLFVDYASDLGRFGGTDFRPPSWCWGSAQRLHLGDFDGDHRTDLLCHDLSSGEVWIDYADWAGQFGGTDWHGNHGWCAFQGASLYVGDFDGDGQSDLLCHRGTDGKRWIDHADNAGHFGGTGWTDTTSWWCSGNGNRMFVGDVSGNGKDDLLCHQLATGTANNGNVTVTYANAGGGFDFSGWSRAPWCAVASRELL